MNSKTAYNSIIGNTLGLSIILSVHGFLRDIELTLPLEGKVLERGHVVGVSKTLEVC